MLLTILPLVAIFLNSTFSHFNQHVISTNRPNVSNWHVFLVSNDSRKSNLVRVRKEKSAPVALYTYGANFFRTSNCENNRIYPQIRPSANCNNEPPSSRIPIQSGTCDSPAERIDCKLKKNLFTLVVT